MADRQVPFGWKQLLSWGQLERQGALGGVVREQALDGWSTGAYYWAPSEQSALLLSRPCGHCGDNRAQVS